jgi:hypothetical protein
VWASKKSTGHYSAAGAALGGRTLKTGQSRCFVGYKKHTLRLWLHDYRVGVLLVPLVSWVTPANVSEGGLLVPSLHYCQQQWEWCPPLVVADMGYLAADAKRRCRERWHVAVLTKLRSDMKLVPPYVAWNQAACAQGEPLTWLGYDGGSQEHWFGTGAAPELCARCWEAARCPRQFAYRAEAHETLLGLLPLASPRAQRVLQQVRPWIEPAQSYEKNQLGLGKVFLNGLRFTWAMGLLADAAVLLRARVLLGRAPPQPLLAGLMPRQLPLGLQVEDCEGSSPETNSKPQNLQ